MAAGGGSIEGISINARNFSVASDSDPGRILGGKKNSIELNGDDSARVIQARTTSKISGIAVQIDDDKEDHEFIQDVIDAGVLVPVTITYNDGSTYYDNMMITEDSESSPMSGTMELTLEGVRLRKQ